MRVDSIRKCLTYLKESEKKGWEESGSPRDANHIYYITLKATLEIDRIDRFLSYIFNANKENNND